METPAQSGPPAVASNRRDWSRQQLVVHDDPMQRVHLLPYPSTPWLLFDFAAWTTILYSTRRLSTTDGTLSSIFLRPPLRPCTRLITRLISHLHAFRTARKEQLAVVQPLLQPPLPGTPQDSALFLSHSRVCAAHVGLLLQWAKTSPSVDHTGTSDNSERGHRALPTESFIVQRNARYPALVVIVHPNFLYENFVLLYIPGVHGSCVPSVDIDTDASGHPGQGTSWIALGDWAHRGSRIVPTNSFSSVYAYSDRVRHLLQEDDQHTYLLAWTAMFSDHATGRDKRGRSGGCQLPFSSDKVSQGPVIVDLVIIIANATAANTGSSESGSPTGCLCRQYDPELSPESCIVHVAVAKRIIQDVRRMLAAIPQSTSHQAIVQQIKQCAIRQRIPGELVSFALQSRTSSQSVRRLLAAMMCKDYRMCAQLVEAAQERSLPAGGSSPE